MKLEKDKAIFYCFFGLIAVYLLGFIQVLYPYPYSIDFSSQILSEIVSLIILSLPAIIIAYGIIFFKKRYIKILIIIVFSFFCLWGILPGIAKMIEIPLTILNGCSKPTFQPAHRIKMKDFNIVVYRANIDSTIADQITVRQEQEIIPGVIIYNTIHKEVIGCDDKVLYKKISDHSLIIDGTEIHLKSRININEK